MDMQTTIEAARAAGGRELRLGGDLEQLPEAILELADTLEILDLSGNRLRALPDWITELPRLRILFLSGNAFEEVPAVLAGCRALRMLGLRDNRIARWDEDALPEGLVWLVLTGNRLAALPASIGKMRALRKLMLAGNRLEALPEAMAGCQGLELLRLSANRLQALPAWLGALPRLSWLAYAGNPCARPWASGDAPLRHPAPEAFAGADLEALAWHELEIGDRLGEGASGVIHTAAHMKPVLRAAAAEPALPAGSAGLAVKVFRGGLTSDGFPEDEMQACVAAGRHRHLVPVVGPVAGHPEGRAALAMRLVPADHVRLGAPPDFETCTRDTFAAGVAFDVGTILRVARAIASAGAHLHARGVLHGDLYAHNILVSPEGGVLLGDFGAASPLPRDASRWAERLEVRAFGCLLDDLLARRPRSPLTVPASPIAHFSETSAVRFDRLAPLEALRDRCLVERPESRPLFAEILETLPAA